MNSPACCAPFVQLSMHPNGKVFPCCYHQGFSVGNIQNDRWESLWNGNKIQKLREDLLSNAPKICRSRMHHLSCQQNFESFRDKIEPAVVQKKSPLRLDIRLNGKCNLRCIMCDVWEMENHLYDETFFWKEGPSKIFPFLEEIEILGGEPFIQEDTYKLIDEVYKTNPNCKFGFVTNGNYPGHRRVIPTLERIHLQYLQLSLDSLDPINFAKIRRDGNLEVVLKSLDQFLELKNRKNFDLKCSITIIRQNIHESLEFVSFCLSKKIIPLIQIAFHDPSGNSALKFADFDELANARAKLEDSSPEMLPFLKPVSDYVAFLLRKN